MQPTFLLKRSFRRVPLAHGDTVHFRLNVYSSSKYQKSRFSDGTGLPTICSCREMSNTVTSIIYSNRPSWLDSVKPEEVSRTQEGVLAGT